MDLRAKERNRRDRFGKWLLVWAILAVSLAVVGAPAAKATGGHPDLKRWSVPTFEQGKVRDSRIIGGQDAAYPWQVALAAGTGGDQRDFFCGGTLIARDLVLTAAHCVENDQGDLDQMIARHGLRALVGRAVLSSPSGEVRQVDEIWTWESYNPKSFAWDIAVLVLATPSTVGTPIRIAGPNEAALWGEGRQVWVSGWGNIGGGRYPDRLQTTWLTVVGNAPCSAAWRMSSDWATQFCAGAPPSGGRAICDGDSGGPLVAEAASGVVRLVGVVSFGFEPCGSFRPDGFSRVSSDPLQSAIQSLVSRLRPGVDVIGRDGLTAKALDGLDARANAGIYVGWACDKHPRCRGVRVRQCWRVGETTSFQCSVDRYLLRGRRRVTARRTVAVVDGGANVWFWGVGSWRLYWGWA